MATYEFDLVPADPWMLLDEDRVFRMRFLLSEFQPAKRVALVGDPPTRLRVRAHGQAAEVAPALLAALEAQPPLRDLPSPVVHEREKG